MRKLVENLRLDEGTSGVAQRGLFRVFRGGRCPNDDGSHARSGVQAEGEDPYRPWLRTKADLWTRYKESGERDPRNELIEGFLPFVSYIAERLLAKLPKHIELDDLCSAGIFGLIDAIDGYDIDRGIKFETYATVRIRGSILDELRSTD